MVSSKKPLPETIQSAGYACVERGTRIIQETIAPTDRGAMITWLEGFAHIPIPPSMTDEDVKRAFFHWSDKRGGFVKCELIKVEALRNPHDGF